MAKSIRRSLPREPTDQKGVVRFAIYPKANAERVGQLLFFDDEQERCRFLPINKPHLRYVSWKDFKSQAEFEAWFAKDDFFKIAGKSSCELLDDFESAALVMSATLKREGRRITVGIAEKDKYNAARMALLKRLA